MIDILYLARGRKAFTEVSFGTLITNTNWNKARLVVYTDGDTFDVKPTFNIGGQNVMLGTGKEPRVPFVINPNLKGGPVAIMNHFLGYREGQQLPSGGAVADMFAKIDNDVMVPPGWLDRALDVMEDSPELDILGLEPPSSTVRLNLSSASGMLGYSKTDSIGGVGIIRRRAFHGKERMQPHSTYGGFTDWQQRHPEVTKGWISPPLKLFLLDRLDFDPWRSLSKRYIAQGQQRPWRNYTADDSHLWGWWKQAA